MHALASLQAKVNKPRLLYWHGDPAVRKIALTFDDGPNEPYTAEILKILKENQVRATFFLVGKNVEADPQTARDILAAGHAIGNHSYDHRNLVTRTNAQVRQEILKTEKAIRDATGEKTTLFRPPYGEKDSLTVRQTHALGYVMIEWSVSAEDWRRPGLEHIVSNVVKSVRNGSIILMHDGDKIRRGDRSQTVAALPLIIAELRGAGYEFVTVPELLKLDQNEPFQTASRTPPSTDPAKKL
jgi:polysaccharide deacetylase family sporulation protein PdaB